MINSAIVDRPSWYAIRATRGRSQAVYDSLVSLNADDIIPFLPVMKHNHFDYSDKDNPQQVIIETPLDKTLVFVRTTLDKYTEILHMDIPGLTPYYNHFETNVFGRNPYLIVPDRQMESFRIIIESGWEDIITSLADDSALNKGDRVRVLDGPFKGVEGVVLKYKHQRRVFVKLEGIGSFGTGYVHKNLLEKLPPA
ncbi:MAG: UpxY family transcription antiterminator [Prevotella sp.]|nr:UpxY family transcription antiterminator [Prevotella sp.]